MRLHFRVTLRSDYFVGAGHGDGSEVDAALLRDGDGVPVLRGTTIAGLLRHGMYSLLELPPLARYQRCRSSALRTPPAPSYCSERGSEASCPACRLLGSPESHKRWAVGSARPVDLSEPQKKHPWLASVGGSVVARNAIDPRTRRAADGKLFTQERGDGRLEFSLVVARVDEGDVRLAETEAAWIVASARMVRGLGGSRRRGVGECRWHLEDRHEEARLLELFRSRWLQGEHEEVGTERSPSWSVPSVPNDGPPLRVRMIVRNDEPLVVAQRAEAGNQLRSLQHIPGSVLLGALAGQASRKHGVSQSPTGGPLHRAFEACFRRGGVRFPMLYPACFVAEQLIPCMPCPRDLWTCSLFPGPRRTDTDPYHHGVTYGAGKDGELETCATCRDDLDRPGVRLERQEGFLSVQGRPQIHDTRMREEMHIRVHPDTRRAKSGDLYGYSALEAGQYFVGELDCRSEYDWEVLRSLVGIPVEEAALEVRLGRASRRGYGRCLVTFERLEADAPDPLRGAIFDERVTDLEGSLTMTLLTDAILPNRWGQLAGRLDETVVRELLGDAAGTGPVTVVEQSSSTRIVDAFNQHLGLPRWRDIAVTAGSTVTFRLEGLEGLEGGSNLADVRERLRELELGGVGARRYEGFGAVVFNHPHRVDPARLRDQALPLPAPLRPSTAVVSNALADETFAARRWEETLDEHFGDFEAAVRTGSAKEWTALARGIRAQASHGVGAVRELLDSWGTPGSLLESAPVRDKERFLKGKGRKGGQLLRRLLDVLEETEDLRGIHQECIESLASFLSDAVGQPRGDR